MFIYALVLAFGLAVGIGAVAAFVIMVLFAEPTIEELRGESLERDLRKFQAKDLERELYVSHPRGAPHIVPDTWVTLPGFLRSRRCGCRGKRVR
jgi:hypothetical protein